MTGPAGARLGGLPGVAELRRYLVLIVISLGLCSTLMMQAKSIALQHPSNRATFRSCMKEPGYYTEKFRQEWRPRVLSTCLAAKLITTLEPKAQPQRNDSALRRGIAKWSFAWLFLIHLVFIAGRKRGVLTYLLGTYASLSLGYMPGRLDTRIYPWDLPALFFFSLFVVLIEKKRYPWLLLVLPVAMGFKETAIVLCVAFLWWDSASTRRKLLYLGLAVALCGAVKVLIDVWTHNPAVFFSATLEPPRAEEMRVVLNWRALTRVSWAHPALVNAGTLLALLVLPMADRRVRMLKTVVLVFVGCNFVLGMFKELRIFLEMIPLGLYGLEIYFRGDDPTSDLAAPGKE